MLRTVLLSLLALWLPTVAAAAEPLHLRIDKLIDAKAGGPIAPPANDADFLRRAYLDFAGRIPTIAEARAFLADRSKDKRTKLIDKLMASKEYPRRMAELFHVILMERRGDHDEWRKFLTQSFEQNKPWDKLVREILSPNADDTGTRGSAFFITKRLEKYGQNPTDYPGLTRDIGRLFLGMDLQCAQCHDHIHVADYKQHMFQGLFAFVGNVSIRRDVKFPAVAIKPLKKKLDFQSVFVKQPKMTGPRVPGDKELTIVSFKRGEEFLKKPDRRKRYPGVPKFNTLKLLGERLPRENNRQFAANIVNRLWFRMLGRGLVHPLDLHHSGNQPSHPRLMKLLTDDFIAHKYDIKYFFRELALTRTYQRSGKFTKPAGGAPRDKSYRVFNERPLSAEQILRSMLIATEAQPAKTQALQARYDKLESDFVTAFGNTAREPEVDFNPSVKSALFVRNSRQVLDLVQPKAGNLSERLSKKESAKKVAEELYLAVLSRQPTSEEETTVAAFWKSQTDKPKAASHLVWALLASTEFCVNH